VWDNQAAERSASWGIIKGKGHWLMEEAPQQVIPQLVAFISKAK